MKYLGLLGTRGAGGRRRRAAAAPFVLALAAVLAPIALSFAAPPDLEALRSMTGDAKDPALSAPAQPPIHLRKEWGALAASWDEDEPKVRVIVHHTGFLVTPEMTALSGAQALAAVKGQLQGIQQMHMKDPAFHMVDIAYHYLIDWEGGIWEGRPPWALGAHTYDNNPGSLGVCLLGNFTLQRPTRAQLAALLALTDWLTWKQGIPPQKIFGHRDMPGNQSDECPGYYLHADGGDQNPLRKVRLAILDKRQLAQRRIEVAAAPAILGRLQALMREFPAGAPAARP